MNYYRKQKPKRNDEEHQIQKEYFKILSLNEDEFPFLKMVFAIPNGGKRNIGVAVKMKAEGTRRGVPDIMAPIPMPLTDNKFNPEYCHGLFLETKTEKGILSKEQKAYRIFLIEQGYEHIICRSVDELVSATEKYLNITLKNK